MRKTKSGITVLMPCFNHAEYIELAIDSVVDQDVDIPVKLLIFDDCSTDGTIEIIKAKAKSNPNLVAYYLNKKNLGSGLASYESNSLVVDTEFWCTLEGDDYWCDKNKLQKQVNKLRADLNRAGCAGLTSHISKGHPDSLIGPNLREFNLADCALYDDVVPFYVHTSAILWRNLHSYKGMPFPKDFWNLKGDPALMQAMMLNNKSMYVLDSIVSAYRNTGKGRWSSLSADEQRDFNLQYLKKLTSCLPLRYRIIRILKGRKKKRLLDWCIDKGFLPAPINANL